MAVSDREEIHHAMLLQMDKLVYWYRSVRDHIQTLGSEGDGLRLFDAIDGIDTTALDGAMRYEGLASTEGIQELDEWLYASYNRIFTGDMIREWLKAQDAYCEFWFGALGEFRSSNFFVEFLKYWKFRMPEFLADMILQSHKGEYVPPPEAVYAEDFSTDVFRNRLASFTAPAANPTTTAATLTNQADLLSTLGLAPFKAVVTVNVTGDFVIRAKFHLSATDTVAAGTVDDAFLIPGGSTTASSHIVMFQADVAGALTAGQTALTGVTFTKGSQNRAWRLGGTVLIQGAETDSGNAYQVEELGVIEAFPTGTSLTLAGGLLHNYAAGAKIYPCFRKVDNVAVEAANASTSGAVGVYPQGDRAGAW